MREKIETEGEEVVSFVELGLLSSDCYCFCFPVVLMRPGVVGVSKEF